MHLLRNLKTKFGRKISVIEQAATKWRMIAHHLDFNESAVTGIEKKYHHNSQACCGEMMEMWVLGKGKQPATWELLVKTLCLCGLDYLAQQVKEAIN